MTSKKSEESTFDLRTLDSLVSRGTVKQADYDKYLKTLPDEEGNFQLAQIEDDLDDESEEDLDEPSEEEEEDEDEENEEDLA